MILKKKFFLALELIFICRFSKIPLTDLLKVELNFLPQGFFAFLTFIRLWNLIGLATFFYKFGFLVAAFLISFLCNDINLAEIIKLTQVSQKCLNLFCECWIFVYWWYQNERFPNMTLQMKVNGENFTPRMNFSWIKNAHANWKRVKIM